MKRFILILGIAVLAAGASAQGTINLLNGSFTIFRDLLGGIHPAAFPFNVTVLFAETPGAWQGPRLVTPFGRSISDTGLFTGPSILQIPGTEAGQVVSIADPFQAGPGRDHRHSGQVAVNNRRHFRKYGVNAC